MSESKQGRLVAVVVTYNRLEKLEATLAQLLASPEAELFRVVVVDNASTDGTSEWLSDQKEPRLHIIRNKTNSGGAGGFETGMRVAVAEFDPDWLVVMDDDGYPRPGALAAFHEADLSGWDAIAAAVYFPGGEICEMNRPSRNPFWHLPTFLRTLFRLGARSGFHLSPEDYHVDAGPRSVDVASFVGLFLSRRAINLAGYPDRKLFIYGDDGLYTLGLTKTGGCIAFHPSVTFEHDCSTFSGQRGRFQPLWKVYYYHRNLLLLYRKAAGWLFWPLLLVVLPKWFSKVRHHEGARMTFLRLLRHAISDGLAGRVEQEHDRILQLAQID